MTYTKPPDARCHSLITSPVWGTEQDIRVTPHLAMLHFHPLNLFMLLMATCLEHNQLPGGPQSQSKRQEPDHPIVPPPEHWDNLSKLCYVKGGKEHSTFPEITRTTQRPLLNLAESERNLLKKACQFASEFLRNCNAKRLTEIKRFACRT
jgi:hypothetical protein